MSHLFRCWAFSHLYWTRNVWRRYLLIKSMSRAALYIIPLLLVLASCGRLDAHCQVSNCELCYGSSSCAVCQEGYMQDFNKQLQSVQCVEGTCGVSNCGRCLGKYACVSCQDDYQLGQDGLCHHMSEALESAGCARRLLAGKCSECMVGFELVDGECEMLKGVMSAVTVTCSNNIPNCQTCVTPFFCSACTQGMVPTLSGTSCVSPTTINNCLMYSSSLTCGLCQNGYYLAPSSGGGNTCAQVCVVPGCSTCVSGNPNSCQQCLGGFTVLSDGTCSPCPYPCATCLVNSVQCLTCLSPFSLNPSQNGICYTCNVAGCQTCSIQEKDVCTTCFAPLKVYNGICLYPCDSDLCVTCTNTGSSPQAGFCTKCVTGYVVVTGSYCVICAGAPLCTSCSSTNTSVCLTCISGYFVNTNNACQACATGCSQCTGVTIQDCTQFTSGQKIYNNFAMTTYYTQPGYCPPGCASCSSLFPGACLSCTVGFAWSSWTCTPCAQSCETCSSTNPATCYSCYSNGFYNSTANTCTYCSNNCQTCLQSNLSQCTSCAFGRAFVNEATCSLECPQSCLTCEKETGQNITCTSCYSGFSLSPSGVCLPCMANCRVCSGIQQNICLSCSLGYYYDGYTCVACSNGCQSCTRAGCTACAGRFYLFYNTTAATTQCAENCVFPCASCSPSSPTTCTSCYLGYNLYGTNCLPQACQGSSTNACYNCPSGTSMIGGTCATCSSISNCATCQSTTNNQISCLSCSAGYYLGSCTNSKTKVTSQCCIACATGCSSCSNSQNCLQCASGYIASYESVTVDVMTCQICQPPCGTCAVTPSTCTSCQSGFTFTGWNCISNLNYNFTIVLNTDIDTFYDNYQAFLAATTSAMQTSNYKVVAVEDVYTYGPSNDLAVYCILSTLANTQAEATLEYQNLQYALAPKRGYFAGMEVVSSTITSSQTILNPKFGPGYYAALFVPLSFLVVVGLGYYIMSNRNMDLPFAQYQATGSPSARSVSQNAPLEMREL